ncbi:hypothetical protein GGF50DRAFT_65360 [Schizophyllum commune]
MLPFWINAALDELGALIKETHGLVDGSPDWHANPRVEANARQIVRILRDRNLLGLIFREQPPPPDDYVAFVERYGGDYSPIRTIYNGMFCVSFLFRLAQKLDRPELCPFDATLLQRIFLWIVSLLPVNHEPQLRALSSSTQSWLLVKFTMTALTYIQTFTHIISANLVHQVLRAEDEQVTSMLVNMWLNWSRVHNVARAMQNMEERAVIQRYLILLPGHYISPYGDGAIRNKVVQEILRTVRDRPRRFFRLYGMHLRLMLTYSDMRDSHVPMEYVVQALLAFMRVPELGRQCRMPKTLIVELIACIRCYVRSHATPSIWPHAVDCLLECCLDSRRSLTQAVEAGLFHCLVQARPAADRRMRNQVSRLLHVIAQAARSPRVILAFRSALTEDEDKDTLPRYTDAETGILCAFDFEYDVLQELKVTRELTATCCNAECPHDGGNPKALRACICGEALYCSKACQRAHWTIGQHKYNCPTRLDPEQHGSLRVKNVYRLVAEARTNLLTPYAQISCRSDPSSSHVSSHIILDLRRRAPGEPEMKVFQVNEELLEYPPATLVDVGFDDNGKDRVRRIKFVREEYAGHVRVPFRLITEGFADSGIMGGHSSELPTRLPFLSKRERLFGRDADEPCKIN